MSLPRARLESFWFPEPARGFPGQRWARTLVRTWHLLSMALLVGATAMGQPLEAQTAALWGTFLSGLVFVGMELYTSGVWLFQLKGWVVLIKLALFASAMLSTSGAMPYLVTALVIGGISSHMPGRFRYYSVWHGRVVKAGPSG